MSKTESLDLSLLRNEERAAFALRELYVGEGYTNFKMSKFEEYDLYRENKDFLVSQGVITFNDRGGRLLALKPDVTLSIIKNSTDGDGAPQKYYYSENVYRQNEGSGEYREIMQTGIECIGELTDEDCFSVARLAAESLLTVGDRVRLGICSVGLVDALMAELSVDGAARRRITEAILDKNIGALKAATTEEEFRKFSVFLMSGGRDEVLGTLEGLGKSPEYSRAYRELKHVVDSLVREGYGDIINIDFSMITPGGYYSGIIFRGYVEGIGTKVLSGGRYDGLMRRMGRRAGAIGFAVYLDALERSEDLFPSDGYINVALPKGRLGESVYEMFERAGYDCPAIKEGGRKLTFENKEKRLRFFWVKPSDVAIYVERGAADIGVAGKDILLEYTPDVYELLDLRIGKCRMAVAAKNDFIDDKSRTLKVATKFSNIAKAYYREKCRDIDIIHLNGSIEIAPILGLSDVIVDIVETGKTLLENGLSPRETIHDISARLISNKASYGFMGERIERLKDALEANIK